MLSIFDHHTHFLQLVLLPDKKANQVLTVVLDHYIFFLDLETIYTQVMAFHSHQMRGGFY